MRPPKTIIGKAKKIFQSFVKKTLFHQISPVPTLTGIDCCSSLCWWAPRGWTQHIWRHRVGHPAEGQGKGTTLYKHRHATRYLPPGKMSQIPSLSSSFKLLLCSQVASFCSWLPMVLRNLPDVYISSALSLGHLMTENNQTTAGTTRPANAQPCYCCKMLKASAPFKRVVSRLLSEDPTTPQVRITWSRDLQRESWTLELVEGHRPWRYIR